MSEKAEQNKLNSDENELKSKRLDWEARQNLLGFFNLLLQIDIRNNPEKYKKPKK